MTQHGTENRRELSLHAVHKRLQIVEVILFISLVLNLALWYAGGVADKNMQNQVNDVKAQTGTR